jgi:hypothetical protein
MATPSAIIPEEKTILGAEPSTATGLLFQKNFCEAKAPLAELPGVLITDERNTLFADFREKDLPRSFREFLGIDPDFRLVRRGLRRRRLRARLRRLLLRFACSCLSIRTGLTGFLPLGRTSILSSATSRRPLTTLAFAATALALATLARMCSSLNCFRLCPAVGWRKNSSWNLRNRSAIRFAIFDSLAFTIAISLRLDRWNLSGRFLALRF